MPLSGASTPDENSGRKINAFMLSDGRDEPFLKKEVYDSKLKIKLKEKMQTLPNRLPAKQFPITHKRQFTKIFRFSASAVRLFPLCKKTKDKISAERFSLAYKIS